jgi:hypothetical protein
MKYTYEKPDGETLTLSLEENILLSDGKGGGSKGEPITNENVDTGLHSMYYED